MSVIDDTLSVGFSRPLYKPQPNSSEFCRPKSVCLGHAATTNLVGCRDAARVGVWHPSETYISLHVVVIFHPASAQPALGNWDDQAQPRP